MLEGITYVQVIVSAGLSKKEAVIVLFVTRGPARSREIK
jgi:hypothetical protein